MAVCVAVIGKDNGPLLVRCRAGEASESELQYHYIVSSALDVVEERVQSSKSLLPAPAVPTATEATRELYLGALTAQEDYKVYGYMTNTRVKFIIVVEESSIPMRENDIRMMFRKLHGAFCDLMSNPFVNPGSQITSPRFSKVVDSLLVKSS